MSEALEQCHLSICYQSFIQEEVGGYLDPLPPDKVSPPEIWKLKLNLLFLVLKYVQNFKLYTPQTRACVMLGESLVLSFIYYVSKSSCPLTSRPPQYLFSLWWLISNWAANRSPSRCIVSAHACNCHFGPHFAVPTVIVFSPELFGALYMAGMDTFIYTSF